MIGFRQLLTFLLGNSSVVLIDCLSVNVAPYPSYQFQNKVVFLESSIPTKQHQTTTVNGNKQTVRVIPKQIKGCGLICKDMSLYFQCLKSSWQTERYIGTQCCKHEIYEKKCNTVPSYSRTTQNRMMCYA